MFEHRHWRTYWSSIPGQKRWTFTQLVDAALADATKAVNALRKDEGAQNIQRETVIINRGKDYLGKDENIFFAHQAVVMIVISYDVEV